MTTHKNLLGGPDPTHLPENEEAYRLLGEESQPPAEVAAKHPTFSLAWAMLADDAFEAGRVIESYAYARTGYHRGLDSLRRAGWKGHGPIPWDHRANRGFLRCLAALARAMRRDRREGRDGALLAVPQGQQRRGVHRTEAVGTAVETSVPPSLRQRRRHGMQKLNDHM